MYIKIEKKPPQTMVHIIWGAIAIIVIIGAGIFSNLLYLSPPCIFRILTGIPCLTCGGTHCIISMAQFKPITAFIYNPLVMLVFLGMIILSLGWMTAFLTKKRLALELSRAEKRVCRGFVILLVAANWIYLIIQMT